MINKIWINEFGDDYHERNVLTPEQEQARLTFFVMLARTLADGGNKALPKSILEVGAGTGHNLKALKQIIDSNGLNIKMMAIEPNKKACEELQKIEGLTVLNKAVEGNEVSGLEIELVITCGMLIHVAPKDIMRTITQIYSMSSKYLLIMEYFSAEEREVLYRGESEALWTRDYGKLFMEVAPLHCIGYGFLWKPITHMDNITWWLFEKVH